MNFFPCNNLSRKHFLARIFQRIFFPCKNLSRKQYSLQESFKETVFLARILQGNLFLARFLQDVLQKNALSCKTVKENLARSLQGTHFFQPGQLQGIFSLGSGVNNLEAISHHILKSFRIFRTHLPDISKTTGRKKNLSFIFISLTWFRNF